MRKIVVFLISIIVITTIIYIVSQTFDSQDIRKTREELLAENRMDSEKVAASLFGKPKIEFTESEKKSFSSEERTVIIYPIFTQSAYGLAGFYDYFNEICDESCLTIEVDENYENARYTSSKNSLRTFETLNWNIIDDLVVHKNPAVLSNYDKVILLHNEYVTKLMFEVITSHPNVIYLYPNALYAEVKYDEDNNTISLIRGHNFPETEIRNGFDWQFDNSPNEYDTECENWQFDEIDNGIILDCYPELIIYKDKDLIRYLKEY